MKYKVNIDNNNKLHGLTRELFEEGEEVVFFVPFVTDVDTYVTSQDVRIESLHSENSQRKYGFIMPAHDVTVDVSFRGGMTCIHQPQGMPLMGMMGMGTMSMQQIMPQPANTSAGVKDAKFCPECGAVIPKTAKFCSNCGVRCKES